VVTLGMMGALRGAAKELAGSQPIYPDETWLNGLMQLGRTGLPSGVWLMLGLAVLLALALRFTRFGRHVFAVGSNELTARLCGVPVERVKLGVYILGGGFAGIAAVLQFAYLTGGDPTTAAGLELNIIAAVVIGGASLSGGQGTVLGTLVGALLMSVVANGCTKLGLDNPVQEIVTGIIIIGAVLLDYLRRKSEQKS
jgi:ribose/xylose/arabinose/galactoside ABC-type transport system permease subunit